MNAYTLFSRTLEQRTDSPWLHTPEHRYSGADVVREAARHAAWLQSLGLAPGDRVLAQLPDRAQTLFFYLGVLRAGGIFVPLPTAWTPLELADFIDDCKPRVIVCQASMRDAVAALVANRSWPAQVFAMDETGELPLRLSVQPTHGSVPAPIERADEDGALILYSAGTTGQPRGALMSHGALKANASALAGLWQLTADDTLMTALPLFTVHGLCAALHPALIAGARLMLPAPRDAAREPEALVAACKQATVLVATPDLYAALLREPALTRAACARLRLCLSTAAHLPRATAVAFGERSGQVPRQCYGSCEAGIVTAHAVPGQDPGFRIDSAGKPLPGTRLRIVGANLKPMPLEHQGEIQLPAFAGGWRCDRDAAMTADGWFRTGDIGMWDEHGYIVVVGRAADVIASGYYKIYPEDVEHALEELPGVAEAAVIGRPHAELGEEIAAFIVRAHDSHLDEETTRAALQPRLAHYQLPHSLHFVAALPRNALGRLQKMRLREAAAGQADSRSTV